MKLVKNQNALFAIEMQQNIELTKNPEIIFFFHLNK